MEVEPYDDFSDLRIEHRHAFRAADRMRDAAEYHRRRDQFGIESLAEWEMERVR
jgi:hypothetical protein